MVRPRPQGPAGSRDIGVCHACEGANNFKRQVWPDTYQALAAPEPDEWERNQRFAIPNPPSSPWSGWDELYIDPTAPIGPKTWVAGFEVSGRLRRAVIGPVKNLRQKFIVTDVRTGKEVTMGSDHAVYIGAVTGMSTGPQGAQTGAPAGIGEGSGESKPTGKKRTP